MKTKILVLPTLCLSGAALLFAPLHSSRAFNKITGTLSEAQRDFRVFDNFLDASANGNTSPASQFPGQTGAELAIWKGTIEWSSTLHGDGTNDPLNNPLGSGGANFDPMWAGKANGPGTANHNIVAAITTCGGGGTLAFTDLPLSDGWRITFCDEHEWDDGPGFVPGRWDMQGVMCHEYGHALGLGHSGDGNATMTPGLGLAQTFMRSINSDDIAGVQCKYGLASATKPVITATVANTGANTLTIYGSEFGATGNEVWFTNKNVTSTSIDPIVRVTNVSSSNGGTVITVPIPASAGPGDVIVNEPPSLTHSSISNAFPTDLVGTFGNPPVSHPDITNITPSVMDALIPGTAETITLTGTDLDLTTAVLVDGAPLPASTYTVVNATTITLDMPLVATLGSHDLGVTDGVAVDEFTVTVVAPATPKLEWGNGDALNVVDRDNGLDIILGGQVGELHLVRGSPNGPPTFSRYSRPEDMVLIDAGAYVIPAQGWIAVHIGQLPDPAVVGSTWFAKSFSIGPRPFPASNDQSIVLVP